MTLIYGVTAHRDVLDTQNKREKAEKAFRLMVNDAKRDKATLSIGGAKGGDSVTLEQAYLQEVPFILRLPFKTDLDRLKKYLASPLCTKVTWEKRKWESRSDVRIYFERNQKIINDLMSSSGCEKILCAYYDGRPRGGTLDTIKKALRCGATVHNYFDNQYIYTEGALKRSYHL